MITVNCRRQIDDIKAERARRLAGNIGSDETSELARYSVYK